jgi:hypothetical protein
MGKRTGYNSMVGQNLVPGGSTGTLLYVPLEFWFCRNVGLALPLIALIARAEKHPRFQKKHNMSYGKVYNINPQGASGKYVYNNALVSCDKPKLTIGKLLKPFKDNVLITYDNMKRCSRCKLEKDLDEFNQLKSAKDGKHPQCKDCKRHYRPKGDDAKKKNHEYYQANRDSILEQNKQYRIENADQINLQRKQYRERTKEHIAMKNKEYLPIKSAKIKEKRKTDACFRLKEQMRTRLHKAMQNHGGKNCKTVEHLGCDIQTFREWIEYQFEPWMNWDNYGQLWDVDHILPVNRFNLTNLHEMQVCFNWTNMQPLEKKTNIAKHDNIELHYYFNSIVSVHRFINNHQAHFQGYQSVCESLHWLRKELRYGKNPVDDRGG